MGIGADSQKLKINPTGSVDFFFVGSVVGFGISRHAIGKMDIFDAYIHMPKQIFLHESAVGLRVLRSDSKIFVEVETCNT